MFEWDSFFIGAAIGLTSAILGGLIEYRVSSRREEDERGLPGCMLLVTGALGFVGLVVTAVSWLVSRDLSRPVVAGIGVGSGFFLGFLLLLIAWILFFSNRNPSP